MIIAKICFCDYFYKYCHLKKFLQTRYRKNTCQLECFFFHINSFVRTSNTRASAPFCGREHVTCAISCLYLFQRRTQSPENDIILAINVAKFFLGSVFFWHYIMCDNKQRVCFKNMPGLTCPKSAIHQNSYFSITYPPLRSLH